MDALERLGPAGVVKAELIRPFLGQGVDRSTLYRWFELLMESGRPGQRIAKSVETAVKAREERAAAKGIEPAEELIEAVRATLPVAVRVEDLAGAPAITVMDRLATAIGWSGLWQGGFDPGGYDVPGVVRGFGQPGAKGRRASVHLGGPAFDVAAVSRDPDHDPGSQAQDTGIDQRRAAWRNRVGDAGGHLHGH
jgi:hypothetical protein